MVETLGLKNVTNNTAINSTSPDMGINQTASKIGDIGPAVAGTPEYFGLLMLIFTGAGLFKAEVSTDVSGVILVPMALFLSINGYMPVPNGIIYGILVGIASMVGFGIFRYAFR